MPKLTIELSDDLQAEAEARAAASGHATVADYLSSLVRADVELARGMPARVTVSSREELESKLAEALDGTSREVDLDEWVGAHIRRVTLRHGRSKAG